MKTFSIAVGVMIGLIHPMASSAQAPQIINYQGRLLSGTNLVNGNIGLSLRLFNAPSGGAKVYEDSNTVAVVDGLYSTFIGDNTTSGSLVDALTNAAVYVEVAVNNIALTPRERLASVAYALATSGLTADSNSNLAVSPDVNSIGAGAIGHSTIGGGTWNTIQSNAWKSSIGGGELNSIQTNSDRCFIGGGAGNIIRSGTSLAVLTGGFDNESEGSGSFIGGGTYNKIGDNGANSVIAGGQHNTIAADAQCSFAAGCYAFAKYSGSFVWSDFVGGNPEFVSTAANQFLVRAAGGVGINTNSPKGALHVNGDYYGKGHVFLHAINGDGLSGTAYLQARDDSGTSSIGLQLRSQNAGAVVNSLYISPTGTVGIGTASPVTRLHIKQAQDNNGFGADNDGLRIESASGEFWGIQTQSGGDLVFDSGLGTGYAYISKNQGTFNVTSDARFKKDVEPMSGTLNRVLQLRPVTFRYKEAPEESKPVTGFIAQEVLPLFPDVVDEKDGYFAINYGGIGPIAVAAIQELTKEVREKAAEAGRIQKTFEADKNEKDAKIVSLEDTIFEMRERLDALERK